MNLTFVCIYILKQSILRELLEVYKNLKFEIKIYKNINDKK